MTNDKQKAKDAITRRARNGAHALTAREAYEARKRIRLWGHKRR